LRRLSLNKEIGVEVVTPEKFQRKRKIVDDGNISKEGNRLVKRGDRLVNRGDRLVKGGEKWKYGC
jgi:hypothetical protein